MAGNIGTISRRATCKTPKMKMLRHAVAVVHRVVVPEHRFAPKLLIHSFEVPRGNLSGTDFLTGPENLDIVIQQAAKGFQITRRTLSKHSVQHRIIRIVTGAYRKHTNLSALPNPVHDIYLRFSKPRSVGAHVIKQYGQFINPD